MKLKVNEKTIFLGKRQIILDYKIDTAYKRLNKIIVRFRETKNTVSIGRFYNLICIDLKGKMIWKAELPTMKEDDRYCYVLKYWPNIVANSWSNNECVIDSKTGKILSKKFTKT